MSAHEPAFPIQFDIPNSGPEHYPGVDIRTYLAGQMMAGLLSNGSYIATMSKAAKSDEALLLKGSAVIAVKAADALITELNKDTK